MGGRGNYFKIGVFTLAALALFAAGLLVFGLAGSLAPKLDCVTLFGRSVQGLSVGSAVKFRGFTVGQVSALSLSSRENREGEPLVRVDFYIDPEALTGREATPGEAREYVFTQLGRGLKVYLSFQGVTGVGFLDLDYNRESSPAEAALEADRLRRLSDEHGVTYIPNGPGRIMEIGESASRIVESLSRVDFSALATELRQAVETLQKTVAAMEAGQVSGKMVETLEAARGASAAVADLARHLDENFGRAGLGQAGRELAETLAQLRAGLKRADQLLGSSQNNLPATLENLRLMSENMRELSELLKRYPSQLFFGQGPASPRSRGER